MKKKIIIGVIVVLFLILLIPIPTYLNDDGSIKFKSILYTIIQYHKIDLQPKTGYITSSQGKNSFIGTVLEETTTYMLVEPNEDEEERKSADKIQINYGTDHIDYLYGIGRKVLISYSGYIMETYPAQINTNNISVYGY